MFHGCWCDLRCDHLVLPTCRKSILKYSELSVRCKRCHLLLFFQVAQRIEGNKVNIPLLKLIPLLPFVLPAPLQPLMIYRFLLILSLLLRKKDEQRMLIFFFWSGLLEHGSHQQADDARHLTRRTARAAPTLRLHDTPRRRERAHPCLRTHLQILYARNVKKVVRSQKSYRNICRLITFLLPLHRQK